MDNRKTFRIAAYFLIFSFFMSFYPVFPARKRIETPVGDTAGYLKAGIDSFLKSRYSDALKSLEKCRDACIRKKDDRGLAEAYFWLSRCHLELEQCDPGEEYAKKSLALFEKLKDGEMAFRANLEIVEAAVLREETIRAWRMMDSVEKLNRSGFSKRALIEFYLLRGRMLNDRRKYDLAVKNFDESLRLAREVKDTDSIVFSLAERSQVRCREKKFKEAHVDSIGALEIAVEGDRPYLQGYALMAEGFIHQKESNYDAGIANFLGAASIFRAIKNYGKAGLAFFRLLQVYMIIDSDEREKKYALLAIQSYRLGESPMGQLNTLYQHLNMVAISRSDKDAEEAIDALKDIAGKYPGTLYEAQAYYEMGVAHMLARKKLKEAISLLEKARKAYGKLNYKQGEVLSLANMGNIYISLSDLEKTLESYKEALKIRESMEEFDEYDDYTLYHTYSPGGIYRSIGAAHLIFSRFREALENYQKSVELFTGPKHTFDRAISQSGLLQAALGAHDVDLAWEALSDAFENIPKLKEPYLRANAYNSILMSIFNAGYRQGVDNYFDLGSKTGDSAATMLMSKIHQDTQLSMQIQEGYKEWLELMRERKSLGGESVVLLFRGFYYATGKNYSEARNSYDMGIEVAKKAKIPTFENIGYLLLSLMYMEQDKVEDAILYKLKELEIARKAGLSEDEAHCCISLGQMYRSLGKYKESLDYLSRGIKIARDISGDRTLAYAVMSRGYTYFMMKKYKESVADFREAESLQEKNGENMMKAVSETYLAKNYREMGEIDKALDCYEKAYLIFDRMDGVLKQRDVALEYGALLEKQGRDEEAVKVYLSTVEKLLGVGEKTSAYLGRVDLEIGSPNRILIERGVNLLLKLGRHQEALNQLELTHDMELAQSVNVEKVKIKDPRLSNLLERMTKLKEKMNSLKDGIDQADDEKKRESLSRILASTRSEFLQVMNEIKSRNPDFEQLLSVGGADLAAIQKILPTDILLIEFYPSDDILYIFMVTGESFRIQYLNVGRERLYQLIRDFRDQLSHPDDESARKKMAQTRAMLYSLLLEPVEAQIEKKDRLVIVPGGLLWYLPVEILGAEKGASLVERKKVSYVSSADILKMALSTHKREDEKSVLVAFGDPSGVDLPASKDEVKRIGGIFKNSRVFTGDEASKEKFFQEAPGGAILHIATHSKLDHEDVNNSYIQFAGKEQRLMLGEIYGVQLQNASLVILSSCESGLGEANPGREISSLSSAFRTAGASSVVASLWRVDDEATALLFEEFYNNLKSGLDRSESLRRAKLKLMDDPKTAHPFFWGGFVLMGEPR